MKEKALPTRESVLAALSARGLTPAQAPFAAWHALRYQGSPTTDWDIVALCRLSDRLNATKDPLPWMRAARKGMREWQARNGAGGFK